MVSGPFSFKYREYSNRDLSILSEIVLRFTDAESMSATSDGK